MIFGSGCAKAARKTFMKLTPGGNFINVLAQLLRQYFCTKKLQG